MGSKKRKRINLNLNINITNRWLYAIIALVILLVLGSFAVASSPAGMPTNLATAKVICQGRNFEKCTDSNVTPIQVVDSV